VLKGGSVRVERVGCKSVLRVSGRWMDALFCLSTLVYDTVGSISGIRLLIS